MCRSGSNWWFMHDWSDWASERLPLTRRNRITGQEQHVGFFVEQHRKCKRCGKVQTETSEHTI